MNNVHHLTLAAVRAQNPDAFDALFKGAVHDAAKMVGNETVLGAFDQSGHQHQDKRKAA